MPTVLVAENLLRLGRGPREKLLRIAAQHPGAPVIRDAATFDAVQQELRPNG